MTSMRQGVTLVWWMALGAAVSAAPAPMRLVKPDAVLLAEVSVPPPGFAEPGKPSLLHISLGQTNQRLYADTGVPQEKLREAVRETQLLLWATSPATAPRALQPGLKTLRGKGNLPVRLKATWAMPTSPAAERALKSEVMRNSRDLAKAIFALEKQIERLEEVLPLRVKECKRWQANYDLMRAWLVLRIIHLEEVSKTLGQFRKELPPHDPKKDKGWQLVAREKVADVAARKMVLPAEKRLDQIMKDYPDTVWADLAARNRVRSLGVEWVTMR